MKVKRDTIDPSEPRPEPPPSAAEQWVCAALTIAGLLAAAFLGLWIAGAR